ncbi:MAG: transposase zinc-binding domain-containing protein [Verrucomicrobiota bacterium]
MKTAHLRVADVFRTHWTEYERTQPIAPHQLNAVRHILTWRTTALGGHLYRCDACGSEVPLYNSCRDKHCPTCQTTRKQQWVQDRRSELLPVPYFHGVFTLPHDLHPLIDANRRLLLDEFFGAVNWVLQHFAADPQWETTGPARLHCRAPHLDAETAPALPPPLPDSRRRLERRGRRLAER